MPFSQVHCYTFFLQAYKQASRQAGKIKHNNSEESCEKVFEYIVFPVNYGAHAVLFLKGLYNTIFSWLFLYISSLSVVSAFLPFFCIFVSNKKNFKSRPFWPKCCLWHPMSCKLLIWWRLYLYFYVTSKTFNIFIKFALFDTQSTVLWVNT